MTIMKRLIALLNLFLLALVANCQIAFAQDATSLSNEGLRYWKAAEALLSMSSEKGLVTATNLAKRSLQIVKCQRAI